MRLPLKPHSPDVRHALRQEQRPARNTKVGASALRTANAPKLNLNVQILPDHNLAGCAIVVFHNNHTLLRCRQFLSGQRIAFAYFLASDGHTCDS